MARKMDIDCTQHDFQFTRNWFRNRNLPTFRKYIHPKWAGKPLLYLELGVFEGMSLTWMMQHIVTHEESRAVGVDPWLMTRKLDEHLMDGVKQRARHNLTPWIYPMDAGHTNWKCRLIRGCSAEVLRKMRGRGGFAGITKGSVDICMIDGNHHSLAVLDDCQQGLPLMKPGGWMLFDDVENDHTKSDHVKQGLGVFLEEVGDRVNFLWKHRYMEAYEKV